MAKSDRVGDVGPTLQRSEPAAWTLPACLTHDLEEGYDTQRDTAVTSISCQRADVAESIFGVGAGNEGMTCLERRRGEEYRGRGCATRGCTCRNIFSLGSLKEGWGGSRLRLMTSVCWREAVCRALGRRPLWGRAEGGKGEE